jgi:hypothetical protein
MDLLLSILIISLLVPVSAACISALNGSMQFEEELQDEIALMQLRRRLMLAYDIREETGGICYVYQDHEEQLHKVNRNVIVQPGTLIFLADVDAAWTEMRRDGIYIVYERDGRRYERIIAAV